MPCLLQSVLATLFAGVTLVTTLTTTGGTLQALEQGATLQDALLGALPGALAFFGLLGKFGAAASRQQLLRLPPSTNRTMWAAQIPVGVPNRYYQFGGIYGANTAEISNSSNVSIVSSVIVITQQ